MSVSEQTPSNVADLLAPEYTGDNKIATDPTDEANLIVDVYTKLGLMNEETAEAAPERLSRGIRALHEAHPNKNLEPFVVIQLGRGAAMGALVGRFDTVFSGRHPESFYWGELWDQYDLSAINARRTDGAEEPQAGDIRGHDLAIANNYDEPGLFVGGKNQEGETTDEMRKSETGNVLLNGVDWLVVEAMRRTATTGAPSLDIFTATRFPQMPDKTVGVYCGLVGYANSVGGLAKWDKPFGGRRPGVGVRRSLGLKDNS